MAVPLDQVPVPLSLIPLRVGTLIAPGGLGRWGETTGRGGGIGGGGGGGLRVEGVCHQDMSDFVENVQVSVYRGPLFLKVLQAKRGIVFSFLGYVLYTLSDAKHHFQVFVSFWEHCCNCKCASEA